MGSLPAPLLAHPGGLDAYGGHNNRAFGGYHFHRGPLAGQSFGSKAEGLAALNARQGPAPTAAATPTTAPSNAAISTEARLEKLIRILIHKGVISEAELSSLLPSEEPLGLQQSPEASPAASSYTPTSTETKDVSVRGYYRKNGTYVRPHTRSRPHR
jgi:hypothetical protein